jgi:hypothetical protein
MVAAGSPPPPLDSVTTSTITAATAAAGIPNQIRRRRIRARLPARRAAAMRSCFEFLDGFGCGAVMDLLTVLPSLRLWCAHGEDALRVRRLAEARDRRRSEAREVAAGEHTGEHRLVEPRGRDEDIRRPGVASRIV